MTFFTGVSYFVASSNNAMIPEAMAAAPDVLPKSFTQPVTSQVFCYENSLGMKI